MKSSQQNGQALLIVILIMVIGLTIGLSLIARTVTNLKTSTEEENSQRALSAAEAGIERALKNPTIAQPLNGSFTNNTTYKATITKQSADTFNLNNGAIISRDLGADVWFSTYTPGSGYSNLWNGGGGTVIYWDSAGTQCLSGANTETNINNKAAIELIFLYTPDNGITKRQWRIVYDPCTTRAAQNHFYTSPYIVSVNPNGLPAPLSGYTQAVGIGFGSLGLGYFLRVIPLYADTKIGIYSPGISANNRAQGNIISSTGHLTGAVDQAGDVKRQITAFRSIPNIPTDFLQYGILSP